MIRKIGLYLLWLMLSTALLCSCGGDAVTEATGATGSGDARETAPAPAETDAATVPEETFETEAPPETESETEDGIVARLAVFSDVHIGKTNVSPSPERKFKSALEQLGTLMPDCDAVLISGDMTDRGTDAEYGALLRVWNESKPAGAALCTVLGNHEFFRDGVVRYGGESPELLKECRDAYSKYLGELNRDTVVGDVHIISVSADDSAAQYQRSEEYIIQHVERAAAENPNMPIILIAHEGAGAYFDSGSGNFSQATLNCLKRYPQVIVFSGHTHFSSYDPRMIQQRDYTTVQVPTVGADLWNYSSIDPDQPKGKDNTSEGLLVTVSDEGVVTITRYDYFRKTAIGEDWVIDIPAVVESRKNFTYTDARKSAAAAPTFPEGATLDVSDIAEESITLTFPAAAVTDKVSDGQIFLYRIAVTAEGQSSPTLKTEVLGEYYLGADAAKTYTLDLTGLPDGTTYTATVTAETPWGKTASLTSAAFTTKTAPPADDSDAKVLLHVDYTSGSAADISGSALACETFGTPRLENGVAVLDKESAYAYRLTDDIYKQIPANFSLEFRIYIDSDQTYPWGYVSLVSNTESGGFGVSYYQNGEMQLQIGDGTKYHSVAARPAVGKWIHVLCTYDGTSLSIYLDGTLAATAACSANIKHVAEISRKLVVGADVNQDGNIQTVSNVQVAYVKLYDKGLSAKTAAELAAASAES